MFLVQTVNPLREYYFVCFLYVMLPFASRHPPNRKNNIADILCRFDTSADFISFHLTVIGVHVILTANLWYNMVKKQKKNKYTVRYRANPEHSEGSRRDEKRKNGGGRGKKR